MMLNRRQRTKHVIALQTSSEYFACHWSLIRYSLVKYIISTKDLNSIVGRSVFDTLYRRRLNKPIRSIKKRETQSMRIKEVESRGQTDGCVMQRDTERRETEMVWGGWTGSGQMCVCVCVWWMVRPGKAADKSANKLSNKWTGPSRAIEAGSSRHDACPGKPAAICNGEMRELSDDEETTLGRGGTGRAHGSLFSVCPLTGGVIRPTRGANSPHNETRCRDVPCVRRARDCAS